MTFTIIIDPAPTVVDPPNQTVCAGTPVTVTFSGTNNPTFNWTNDNTIIGLGASGSGNISFTAASVDTGTITVTPVANGCPGASQTFDIIVIGSPVVTQPASLSACAGNPVAVVFSGTPGATFSWTNSNTATGLGASGTGDIGFTAFSVAAVTTGNVSVTPSLGGCTGTAQAFDISINPLPTINLASIACSASLLTYDIILSTTGNMLSASTGIVTGAAGNYAISGIAVGTNVIITSTNTVTGCQFQQTVNAPNCNCNPVSTPTLPNNPTICEGAPTPALTVTVDPGDTVDWYAAPSGGVSLMLGSVSFIPPGAFTPGVYNFYAEARELSTSCTSPTRILVTLTVNAVPSVNQISDIMVCAGETVTVDFVGTASANMNWTNNNPGVGLTASGSGNISFPANFTGNNTTISVIPELNGCPGPLMSFIITVNEVPTVVAPMSQTVCAGIAVAVNFSGTSGATFAWTNSEPSIGLAANGSGNISFITANVSSPTLANFSVTSSLAGCMGATQNFSITVNPAPSVTAPANQSVCVGTAVAVVFSGTSGASFDWTNSNTAIGLGASGAGNINFTSTNTGFSPLMANIVVTPSQNGCIGTPQNFNLTINPPPSLMVVSTSCSTDLLTYSASVSSNATTLTSSAGVVSGNFTISNIPNGMSVVLTASNTVTGCSQQQSVMAPSCTCPPILAPSGANFPLICEGTATPALMVNAPAGITVDWYAAPTGGVPLFVGSSSFTPSGVFTAGSYTFYAESRDISSNCTSALRTPVFLTVNAAPTMTQPIDQAVCAGFVISVGFNGSNGSLFNWTNSNPAIGLAASGAGNISFTATNTGSTPAVATISVTPSLFGCVGQPRTFTITVNPSPTMTDPMDLSACVGEAVALTFAATNAATFTWTNANTAIGLGATGMGNINFTTTNPGNALVTVIPTANGCAGTPQTLSITVLNNPSMNNPGNITSCAGGNVLVSFTGDPGLNYTWTNDNPAIGLSASGMGNINFPASNNTGVETAQITVTPQLGTCTGLPQTFSITIDPAPVVSITGTAVICNGGTATLIATGGTNYSWNGGQTNATITVNPTNTTTYTVTASTNGCSATATATVNISPAIAVQATAVLAFGQYAISCTGASDATINASATGGSGAYQYTWSVAGQNTAILSGIGAGTYSLTVTDANQCTGASTAIVTEPPPLTFDIALASADCGASAATALITPSGGADPFSVLLDGVSVAGGLSPSIPGGQHLVEIMDANGCVADTMVSVILPASPVISLPSEETVTLGETLVIEAQTNLNAWQSLVWTPQPDTSCIACLRQEWVPDVSRVYEVVITDSSGCTATATIRVLVEKRLDIYIPNVFSPNLDGVNDFWTLDAGVSVVALNSLQIFDRWGDMVYFWDAPIPVDEWPGWDGTTRGEKVNPGVFVYHLEIALANGETVFMKGDVTVVR